MMSSDEFCTEILKHARDNYPNGGANVALRDLLCRIGFACVHIAECCRSDNKSAIDLWNERANKIIKLSETI